MNLALRTIALLVILARCTISKPMPFANIFANFRRRLSETATEDAAACLTACPGLADLASDRRLSDEADDGGDEADDGGDDDDDGPTAESVAVVEQMCAVFECMDGETTCATLTSSMEDGMDAADADSMECMCTDDVMLFMKSRFDAAGACADAFTDDELVACEIAGVAACKTVAEAGLTYIGVNEGGICTAVAANLKEATSEEKTCLAALEGGAWIEIVPTAAPTAAPIADTASSNGTTNGTNDTITAVTAGACALRFAASSLLSLAYLVS